MKTCCLSNPLLHSLKQPCRFHQNAALTLSSPVPEETPRQSGSSRTSEDLGNYNEMIGTQTNLGGVKRRVGSDIYLAKQHSAADKYAGISEPAPYVVSA